MRILRSRIDHWTCSKFANWIRGEDKPHALEWGKWKEWKNEQKKQRPFRYWLSDTFLRKLQNVVYFPADVYYTIKIYIRNRFIDKIHYLKTDLTPGEYYDLDTRILHALFNELVNFVEGEQAHLMLSYKDRKYKFVGGKCEKAGLDYLEWACNLKLDESYGFSPEDEEYGKLTDQAESSRKIKQLYDWWKKERPNRVNPYDIVSKKTHGKYYYRLIGEIEDQYNDNDTEMLIELIKIRNHLWI
jgi:hypothetical protein